MAENGETVAAGRPVPGTLCSKIAVAETVLTCCKKKQGQGNLDCGRIFFQPVILCHRTITIASVNGVLTPKCTKWTNFFKRTTMSWPVMTDQSTSTSCVWVGTNLMQAPLDKLDPQQDHALERGKTWTQRSSMQSSTYTLQQQDILCGFFSHVLKVRIFRVFLKPLQPVLQWKQPSERLMGTLHKKNLSGYWNRSVITSATTCDMPFTGHSRSARLLLP